MATRDGRASPSRLWLTVLAALILPFGIVLIPPTIFSNVGLEPRGAAIVFFVTAAIFEEATKAAAVGIAGLRRTRLSWFWITLAAASIVGLVEMSTRHLLYFGPDGYPDYVGRIIFAGVRTVSGHIALSLLCVALAYSLRGGPLAWLVAIVVAGALHSLVNFGARGLIGDGGTPFLVGTAILFVSVFISAFLARKRFDWCTQS